MSNQDSGEFYPKISPADELGMWSASKRELPAINSIEEPEASECELPELSQIEVSEMDIELEAFETGVTPQQIMANRLIRAIKGDT